MRNLKLYGLHRKTWFNVIILLEIMLIIAIVGFYAKQYGNTKYAQAQFDLLYQQRLTGLPKLTSEQQQIVDYIRLRFGSQADNALRILSCENHKLNPYAWNFNSNKTYDRGIFQVNDVHGVPAKYLYDWHTNVDIAYLIYKDSGWSAWTCNNLTR